MYKVYMHIFPNGKKYIGITRKSLQSRWQNGNGYLSCPLVKRAIEKYGWENVKHEIIDESETKEEAENLEAIYIAFHKSNDPLYGYNILPGGDASKIHDNNVVRSKISKALTGRKLSAAHKKKISDGVKKAFTRPEKNGCIGKKASAETKLKMSVAHSNYYNNHPEAREWSRNRMKKIWEDSQNETRIKMLYGIQKHPHAKRVDFHHTEEAKLKISQANINKWRGDNSKCSKSVIQLTKDGQFVARWGSISDAARNVGSTYKTISRCCNHRPNFKSAVGYIWIFETEYRG